MSPRRGAPASLPPKDRRRLLKGISAAKRVLFLLDFDGTLSRIVDRPERARLLTGTRHILARLAAQSGAHVAVLSGRRLPDVRGKIRLETLYYGGNHGLDIAGPDVERRHKTGAGTRRALAQAARRLAERLGDVPGVRVEWKGLGVSVHDRLVPARHLEELHRRLAEEQKVTPRVLLWISGRRVWELRPRAPWNKGRAALYLWRRLGRPLVVSMGDDTTDEDMFEAMRGRGHTFRVGQAGPTAARHRLAGPEDAVRFLREALKAMAAVRGQRVKKMRRPAG